MVPTARFLKTAAVVFILVFVVGAVQRLACMPARRSGGADSAEGEVTYVYDGDTLEVSGSGKVRLLGVDALDSRKLEKVQSQARNLGMEPGEVRRWGRRAEEFVRERVQNRVVRLEFGPERRGDHGRLLAQVYVKQQDGESIHLNEMLLRKGLATAYRAFDYPEKGRFIELERKARREGRGLWGQATSTY